MNQARLDEITRLVEGVTPGPWVAGEKHGRDVTGEGFSNYWVEIPDEARNGRIVAYTSGDDVDEPEANIAFIAAAPQIVTELLAEVRRLGEVVAAAGKQIAEFRRECDPEETTVLVTPVELAYAPKVDRAAAVGESNA